MTTVKALRAPYTTVLKPYGSALVALARQKPNVVCLGADLTRQTETDLFRDQLGERFFNGAMSEQNLMGVAAGLARAGHQVFVNTFGVFATRRPYEQIAMQIAYPALDVKIVGLMPGLSTPGGPSHQATDDIALMRALPNMTVVDVADAREIPQAVTAISEIPGPVYLRLKRGEIPVLFDEDHRLDLDNVVVVDGETAPDEPVDLTIFATGMMVATALAAADALRGIGISVDVVNVACLKPLDTAGVLREVRRSKAVVTAENHSVIGGLGSAVAEVIAEAGLAVPFRRVGIQDTFARAASARYLFEHYGLGSQHLVDTAAALCGRSAPFPKVAEVRHEVGAYSPV
ncbi:transketolase subunit B [Pseudonocardia thermophila]|jgi:Transketolase, C-terminal subunit|uniref:Transketolase subunit B n=1 Tax=Pseudonocardia thermophila TaxID=1848 RepID=A0A1M6XL17_PSETH|nr:transketolase C-terminal domain-containing protein [Pseudonocardia thermophila]SHL06702.1 transketolase subunit B [Pseudonocardia thermophila]